MFFVAMDFIFVAVKGKGDNNSGFALRSPSFFVDKKFNMPSSLGGTVEKLFIFKAGDMPTSLVTQEEHLFGLCFLNQFWWHLAKEVVQTDAIRT